MILNMKNKIGSDWNIYDGSYPLKMKHGFDLYLRPGCEYSRKRFIYRVAESNELDYLENQSFEDAVCIDVGANIGYWSVFLSRRQGVNSIHCFEPDPITFEVLKNNLDGADNVIINNSALCDHSGTLDLYIDPDHSGDNRPQPVYGRKYISVTALTMDDYVINNKLKKVDFVKIDVQGGERSVLEGGCGSIREYRPILFVEFAPEMNDINQPPLADYLMDLLSRFDYMAYSISDKQLVKIGHEELILFHGNLIIKPRELS